MKILILFCFLFFTTGCFSVYNYHRINQNSIKLYPTSDNSGIMLGVDLANTNLPKCLKSFYDNPISSTVSLVSDGVSLIYTIKQLNK